MKKINNILFTLVLSFLIFPSYGNISQDKSTHFSTIDNTLLCNKWELVKTTIISEKVIYKDESNTTLDLNCEQNIWKIKEGKSLISSGTWTLNNSMLELKTQNESRSFSITELGKKKLIITYSNVVQEYVR